MKCNEQYLIDGKKLVDSVLLSDSLSSGAINVGRSLISVIKLNGKVNRLVSNPNWEQLLNSFHSLAMTPPAEEEHIPHNIIKALIEVALKVERELTAHEFDNDELLKFIMDMRSVSYLLVVGTLSRDRIPYLGKAISIMEEMVLTKTSNTPYLTKLLVRELRHTYEVNCVVSLDKGESDILAAEILTNNLRGIYSYLLSNTSEGISLNLVPNLYPVDSNSLVGRIREVLGEGNPPTLTTEAKPLYLSEEDEEEGDLEPNDKYAEKE